MYIKNIRCENYGPIDNLDLNFSFNGQQNPIPVVLVGQNGAGKSLILSSILESLIEIKRQAYQEMPEIDQDQMLKLQKKDYIKSGQEYSNIGIQLEHEGQVANFIDFATGIPYTDFVSKYPSGTFSNFDINDQRFKDSGFYKKCNASPSIIEAFKKNVFLYFPYFRYENPAWLNPSAKIEFSTVQKFFGKASENIVKTNIVKELESWLLNLVLDQALYEKQTAPFQLPEQSVNPTYVNIFLGYRGNNTTILNLINELLTTIYQAKDKNIERARIGISPKGWRRIEIILKRRNETNEITIAPTFSHLSSGELMVLSLFCSILREYDMINQTPASNLPDVSGIVLIDEIDLHLHIQFQKDIIPKLLAKFPRIQFIVATHSPFFLLGLNETYHENISFFNLPEGNAIQPEDFVEFQSAYDTFIRKNEQFRDTYKNLSNKISAITKPLIVTEGKTDWKHLKNALSKLQSQGKFHTLDIEFLEYDYDMGDTQLLGMCGQLSKISHAKKVIFIFDRDNEKIVNDMSTPEGFKTWGNNVFSFCIPTPDHRSQYRNISIEFYYTGEEIKTVDEALRRLYFSNEVEERISKSLTTKQTIRKIIVRANPKTDEEFEKKIYDQDCDIIVNKIGDAVAISKSVFAENVYSNKAGFDQFNVSQFEKIFTLMEQIVSI